jgi:endonuclease-3
VVLSATGGTYTLVIECTESVDIEVGALGVRRFEAGWYAYVGSANGTGGFSRVKRHRELAAGERDTRHWHIDYLLGDANTSIETVVTTDGVDAECAIATDIDGEAVRSFGCSDCSCEAHLFFAPDRTELLGAVEDAHENVG